jgi:hypothetical protein
MPYSRKFEGELIPIKVPAMTKDRGWLCSFLNADGTTTESGFAGHSTIESCWICCMAHNNRIGYTKKEVKKIIAEIDEKTKSKKDKKAGKKGKGGDSVKKDSKGNKKSKKANKTADIRVQHKVKGRSKK